MSDLGPESGFDGNWQPYVPPLDLPYAESYVDPAALLGATSDIDCTAIGVPTDRFDNDQSRDEPAEPEASREARAQGRESEPPPSAPSGGQGTGRGPTDGPPPGTPSTPAEDPGDDEQAMLKRYAEELRDIAPAIPPVVEVIPTNDRELVVNRGHRDQNLVTGLVAATVSGVPKNWLRVPHEEGSTEGVVEFMGRQGDQLVHARQVSATAPERATMLPPDEKIELAVEAQAVLSSPGVRDVVQGYHYDSIHATPPLIIATEHDGGARTEYHEIPSGRAPQGLQVPDADVPFGVSWVPEVMRFADIAQEASIALAMHGITGAIGAEAIRINDATNTLHIAPTEFGWLDVPEPVLEPGQVIRFHGNGWHPEEGSRDGYRPAAYSASEPGNIVVMRSESIDSGEALMVAARKGDVSCPALTLWNSHTSEGAVVYFDQQASLEDNLRLFATAVARVPTLEGRGTICHVFGLTALTTGSREIAALTFQVAYAAQRQGLLPHLINVPVDMVRLEFYGGRVAAYNHRNPVYDYRPPGRPRPPGRQVD